ncbi:hypothetical protein [Azospirillum largimobile]
MKKVDVAICAYGKPYHTAVSLLSLLDHSGAHIDKIYFQEEKSQPFDSDFSFIRSYVTDADIIHYVPSMHHGWHPNDVNRLSEEDYRTSIRYQYAWENTDKNYLFIMHNDCRFSYDIIGDMLSKLDSSEYTGVGPIGQCWNCPAHHGGACDGSRYESYTPTYEEVCDLIAKHPSPRTSPDTVDRQQPMPLPECRLNEFYCLINISKIRDVVSPKGEVHPIGMMGIDTGVDWFRQLVLHGYRFLNWYDHTIHGWTNASNGGHQSNTDAELYKKMEETAKSYFLENWGQRECGGTPAMSSHQPAPPLPYSAPLPP